MGTKTRGNENKGESYRVRTGSELTGVVSERVLTKLQCQWEKQAKAIDFVGDRTHKNMMKLFDELNVQHRLLNQAAL